MSAEQFVRENPRQSAWVDDLQPGDEIWKYEFGGEAGGSSGYVLLRGGEQVKDYTNMHWSCAAPHFVLLWEGERPSLREMTAVRRFDEHLRDKPIHDVRKLLENAPFWDCGEAWSYMRPDLEERAKRLGLRYELRNPF